MSKLFAIYDLEFRMFWSSPGGKTTWKSPGAAKNAWLVQQPYTFQRKKFSDQARFICVPVRLEIVIDE